MAHKSVSLSLSLCLSLAQAVPGDGDAHLADEPPEHGVHLPHELEGRARIVLVEQPVSVPLLDDAVDALGAAGLGRRPEQDVLDHGQLNGAEIEAEHPQADVHGPVEGDLVGRVVLGAEVVVVGHDDLGGRVHDRDELEEEEEARDEELICENKKSKALTVKQEYIRHKLRHEEY